MKPTILECHSVSVRFDNIVALDRVSLSIMAGDFFGIIGPNGAGKSTLIKVMSGILAPTSGDVNLDNINIRTLSRQKIATDLAVVLQEETSEIGFTVEQYVALGRSPHHGGLYFENDLDREIVKDAMDKTQTQHLANREFDSLSGGEKQRVRIARALAQEPRILILDEPTNHLDIYSQINLTELLEQINHKGISIIIVSHDVNFMCGACDQLKLMNRGKLIAEGSSSEVVTQQNLAEAFKIRAFVDINPVTMSPRITPLGRI
ncbi:MAG: ABC transporter ATP-binding protein [Desulfomonilaceae bacterium]